MALTIALVGNPNSGKTTLFNQLTGNHQYVGNWPGVTVERKTGKLKNHSDVDIVDLPGIYSLSPYSNEEVIARDYLIQGAADVIIDIVDASNLERNLYLTTQLMEFGVPVVIALNQMDIVRKRGFEIDSAALSERLELPVVEISALQGEGIDEIIAAAKVAANGGKAPTPARFSADLEALIEHLQADLPTQVPAQLQRYYAIKYLERDEKVLAELGNIEDLDGHVREVEARFGDRADAVISNERYNYITSFIDEVQKKDEPAMSTTAKVDRILLNRVLALPIFVVIIAAIYYISISTVGGYATDWANDGVFGDGWFLDPVAIVSPENSVQARYDAAAEPYDEAQEAIAKYLDAAAEKGIETNAVAANFLADPGDEVLESMDEGFKPDPESKEAQAALQTFESQAGKAGVIASYASINEEDLTETDYFVYVGADNEAKAQALADARNDEIAAAGRSEASSILIFISSIPDAPFFFVQTQKAAGRSSGGLE